MTNAAQMWHIWKIQQMEKTNTVDIDILLKGIMEEMGYHSPTVNKYSSYGEIDIRFSLKDQSYAISVTNRNNIISFNDFDVPDANLYSEEGIETFKRNITLVPALQQLKDIQSMLKSASSVFRGDQYY